jgi:hypothetical protein
MAGLYEGLASFIDINITCKTNLNKLSKLIQVGLSKEKRGGRDLLTLEREVANVGIITIGVNRKGSINVLGVRK